MSRYGSLIQDAGDRVRQHSAAGCNRAFARGWQVAVAVTVLLILPFAGCAPPTVAPRTATPTTEVVAAAATAAETSTATPTRTPLPVERTPSATATETPRAAATATPTETATSSPTATPAAPARRTATPTPTSTPAEVVRATATSALTAARYELTLTEAELNELVQDSLAQQSSVPVSNVTVRLGQDLVTASGRARAGFLTLNMEIDGTITVDEGRAIPEILAIRAGGQPLGGFLRAQVDRMIAPYLEMWLQMDLGIVVESVEIADDLVRIVYRYE